MVMATIILFNYQISYFSKEYQVGCAWDTRGHGRSTSIHKESINWLPAFGRRFGYGIIQQEHLAKIEFIVGFSDFGANIASGFYPFISLISPSINLVLNSGNVTMSGLKNMCNDFLRFTGFQYYWFCRIGAFFKKQRARLLSWLCYLKIRTDKTRFRTHPLSYSCAGYWQPRDLISCAFPIHSGDC